MDQNPDIRNIHVNNTVLGFGLLETCFKGSWIQFGVSYKSSDIDNTIRNSNEYDLSFQTKIFLY